jgi:hypothetical protein
VTWQFGGGGGLGGGGLGGGGLGGGGRGGGLFGGGLFLGGGGLAFLGGGGLGLGAAASLEACCAAEAPVEAAVSDARARRASAAGGAGLGLGLRQHRVRCVAGREGKEQLPAARARRDAGCHPSNPLGARPPLTVVGEDRCEQEREAGEGPEAPRHRGRRAAGASDETTSGRLDRASASGSEA